MMNSGQKRKESRTYGPSYDELEQENALLLSEVLVARKASDITSQHVVAQFTKMDELLRDFEEKVIDKIHGIEISNIHLSNKIDNLIINLEKDKKQ